MSEHSNEFIREIEEELQAEKLAKVWQKYGDYIIYSVLALVLGASAFVGYKEYRNYANEQASDVFYEAQQMLQEDKSLAAIEKFDELKDSSSPGYRVLGQFTSASVLINQGEQQRALAMFDNIISDSSLPRVYRDLARIKSAYYRLDSVDNVQALKDEIIPLSKPQNPWRYSAMELLALMEMKQNNPEEAYKILVELISNAEAPRTLVQRANKLLDVIS